MWAEEEEAVVVLRPRCGQLRVTASRPRPGPRRGCTQVPSLPVGLMAAAGQELMWTGGEEEKEAGAEVVLRTRCGQLPATAFVAMSPRSLSRSCSRRGCLLVPM